jgi:hypothetical protein
MPRPSPFWFLLQHGTPPDLSAGFDTVRFYRLSDERISLAVGLSRGGLTPYRPSEGWAAASGTFAVPAGRPPEPDNDATAHITAAWANHKGDTDAILYAAVNSALTAAGYTRPSGDTIT